jgi:phage shock protein A
MNARRLLFATMVSAAFALANLAFAVPAGAQAALDCEAGTPEEWTVILSASSETTGTQFVCNYTVRNPEGGEGNPVIGGTAITIEYYCSASDAKERFDGVTQTKRPTKTQSIDGEMLTIEEGPKAANPDNPQKNGIFNTLLPGTYNLMEKEWRLLSSQVFATIVVNTNRGIVEEKKRFGVTKVEPYARTLANQNSSGAGCKIPPVGGAATAGARRSRPPVVILAGVGAVLIGGILVWRRRGGGANTTSATVPAPSGPCDAMRQSLDTATEELGVLREAAHDLNSQLERADAIHRQNMVKASMVFGIEIASVVSGFATDAALAARSFHGLKPSGASVLGEMDNWKPPSELGQALQAALARAHEAVAAAAARFRMLTEEASALVASVGRYVDDLPAVRLARGVVADAETAVSQMTKDLHLSNALRNEMDELESSMKTNAQQTWTLSHEKVRMEKLIPQKTDALTNARDIIKNAQGRLPVELAEVEAELKRLRAIEAESLTENTASLANLARQIEETEEQAQYLGAHLREANVRPDVIKATEDMARLQKEIAQLPNQIENLASLEQKSYESYQRLLGQKQDCNIRLRDIGDIHPGDVEKAMARKTDAEQRLGDAMSSARERFAHDLAQKEAAAKAAGAELMAADDYLNDLLTKNVLNASKVPGANNATVGSKLAKAGGQALDAFTGVITWPLIVTGEIIFGVGQSPKEIWEILNAGRANIHMLRSRIGAIELETERQQNKIVTRRRALEACEARHSAPQPQPVAIRGRA